MLSDMKISTDFRVHPGAIAVACEKGGAGKTSLAANLGAALGATDWGVLLVDLDPQGNLAGELGVRDHPDWDQGQKLAEAITSGVPLQEPTIEHVKPHIDLVCGGSALGAVLDDTARLVENPRLFAEILSPLVFGPRGYDYVIIDTPPNSRFMKSAMVAARGLVIPLTTDNESTHSLALMGEWIEEVEQHNPWLTLLGIVQSNVDLRSSPWKEQRAYLMEQFPDEFIDHPIRHSVAAVRARNAGLQAIEFLDAAKVAKAARFETLKTHKKGETFAPATKSLGDPKAAEKLAQDYLDVITLVVERLGDVNHKSGYGSEG